LLKFAILFLNADDVQLNKLGYRIVLGYSIAYSDYQPLYEIAFAKDYLPVIDALGKLDGPELGSSELQRALVSAHMSNFRVVSEGVETVRTRGQMDIRDFSAREQNAVVVAPTSYGKSELLVERVLESSSQAVCILVPTRALIAQTARLLVRDERFRASKVKLITHPETYSGESVFVAVLTQERLHRLFVDHPEIALDALFVDEAHNLLPGGLRAEQLAQTIVVARHRNIGIRVQFFTPFIASPASLSLVDDERPLTGNQIDEYVKVERLFYTDPLGQLFSYDQFLDISTRMAGDSSPDFMSTIVRLAGRKNLVYANRPKETQDIALMLTRSLPLTTSTTMERAAAAISELIDPDYSLVTCIRHGVLFHHGQVPDVLRQYAESLFNDTTSTSMAPFLVTNSTLLEGVNTPADTLFLTTPGLGRGYLPPSAFRNLIGRAGRFKEIFSGRHPRLDLLQPRIYLIHTHLMRKNFSPAGYLKKVADVAKKTVDVVRNPMLHSSPDTDRRGVLLEYLENVEPGSTSSTGARIAKTSIGRLCFRHSVFDFDILASEGRIASNLQAFLLTSGRLSEVEEVIPAIYSIFLEGVVLAENSETLGRLQKYQAARSFYGRFLGWRASNSPFKVMIGSIMAYWEKLPEGLVYIGRAWGEEKRNVDDRMPMYIHLSQKSRAERITLAVAKIKEEQDFVDFVLVRYIEILNDAGLVEMKLYNQIRFGTDDAVLICMLRNGMTRELGRLVQATYAEHITVDLLSDTVAIAYSLVPAMIFNDENEVLIYEAEVLAEISEQN
jgi:hypothetical protein